MTPADKPRNVFGVCIELRITKLSPKKMSQTARRVESFSTGQNYLSSNFQKLFFGAMKKSEVSIAGSRQTNCFRARGKLNDSGVRGDLADTSNRRRFDA